MAEKGFKCFYTVLSLAAVVVLAACGGSETEKAETPAAKKPGTITVISGVYPVFQYKQTPAFFRGMDFDFHFIPPWIHQ